MLTRWDLRVRARRTGVYWRSDLHGQALVAAAGTQHRISIRARLRRLVSAHHHGCRSAGVCAFSLTSRITQRDSQRPPQPAARQLRSRFGRLGGVLTPHVTAADAPVATDPDLPVRPPPGRLGSQPPDHAVTRCTFATAAAAPLVRFDDPAGDHSAVRFEALPNGLQAELVEPAERSQIRASEGSAGHVEVFRMGSVRTSILGRPRRLSRDRRASRRRTLNSEVLAIPGISTYKTAENAHMTPEPSAGTHPLDQYRDPSDAALVRDLAAEVAARYGGELTLMRRANGYSNATWVGDGIAVRIAHTPVDMAREAGLVRALPREVGHPEILGEGTAEGHGWIVTAEVRGQNLQEAWPTLTPAEQQQAVRQLWARAHIVHDASPSLRTHVASHGGFVPATLGDATAAAGRADVALGLSSAQQSRLHEIIEGYFRAAPLVEQSVNHGDLALMNALWDGEVIALLDFEFAVLGPVEIDLCRLVCEARVSEEGQRVDSEAGAAALEIAARHMHPIHGRALIHGAAALDQLRDLDIWLAHDSAEERVEDWRPCRLLTDLLDAEGGYLAPLLR
jgi:aminoglycoside phosphotransferase (APT) family kinase protein